MLKRTLVTCLIVLCAGPAANGQHLAFTLSKEEQHQKAARLFVNPFDQLAVDFASHQIAGWTQVEVDEKECRISPPIEAGAKAELNHHRITVDYTGGGTVELSVAHASKNDLEYVLSKKHLHRRFIGVTSGKEVTLKSPYRGENHCWLLLRTTGSVHINQIRYRALRGCRTLYGHTPARFTFAGAFLLYRIGLAPVILAIRKAFCF